MSGRGREKGIPLQWRSGEYRVEFLPKVKIEVAPTTWPDKGSELREGPARPQASWGWIASGARAWHESRPHRKQILRGV